MVDEDKIEKTAIMPKKTFDEIREQMLADFESGKARDWKQVSETNGRHTIMGWIHKSQDEVEVRQGMVKVLELIEKNMFWPGRE